MSHRYATVHSVVVSPSPGERFMSHRPLRLPYTLLLFFIFLNMTQQTHLYLEDKKSQID